MSLRGHNRGEGAAAHVPTERYLIVSIDGQRFALSADLIQGLLTPEESRSGETFAVQGRDYAPLNLAARLGLAEAGDGPESRMVLVARAGIRACIRVAQVHGLVEFDRTRVLPLPCQFRGDERTWYSGLILFEDSVAVGLHADWLIEGVAQAQGALTGRVQRPPQLAHIGFDGIKKGLTC